LPLLVLVFVCGISIGAAAILFQNSFAQKPDLVTTDEFNARLDEQISVLVELRSAVSSLQESLQGRSNELPGALPSIQSDDYGTNTNAEFGGYSDLMILEADQTADIRAVPQRRLVEFFGLPAEQLNDQNCAEPTSRRLKSSLVVRDVGPFRARLLRPAAESAAMVFERLKAEEPKLYEVLKSYGGFCARLIRGSSERVSRHAFGLALDVSVGGTLDKMGDGRTQFGLILLATLFEEAGWVWGAGFRREDSMHFEVGSELFETWVADGRF